MKKTMLQIIKRFWWVGLLAIGVQPAWGFALLGPLPGSTFAETALPASFGDTWQVIALGYGQPYLNYSLPGGPVWLGDIGGPKNIGEEYRRNAPVIYYAYDENFSGYFGVEGEQAADQAIAIMNSLTNVDIYSADLTEFPFNSQRFNGTAQSLYLTDLKSVTLHLLVEQMGLAEPERYTWTLEDRYEEPGGTCPENILYSVVQRNFGTTDLPLTGPQSGTQYTPYVNNVLYSYGILDDCGHNPPVWTATTVPFSVDPDTASYTAVAANDNEGFAQTGLGGLAIGGFYTGLTRDDMAGLRYLLTTNNINLEDPTAGSLLEATNGINNSIVLMTSNLTSLVEFSLTNAPAVVEANFPNVVVGSSTNFWSVQLIPNVVIYFTNEIGAPYGSPPVLVVLTNGYTPVPLLNYVDTFANVVTNISNFSSNTIAYIQTISVGPNLGAPYTSPPVTNITYQKVILTNVPSGDYYVIPPGTCGYNIVEPLYTNVTMTTNFIESIANFATNLTTGSGSLTYSYQENIVTIFTNHWYVAEPCSFQTPSAADYQGIERVQFVRVPDQQLDPLTDTFLQPITNLYTMEWYNPTNYTVSPRVFQRVVTEPDILFSAADEGVGPAGNTFNGTVTRTIHYNVLNILPNLSGPGVLEGEATFTYNKLGTYFWNGPFSNTNSFLEGQLSGVNETTATPGLLWASYDGTTNTPIVYPNSVSIQQLQSEMIVSVTPTSLPNATNNVPFPTTTFTVTGGQPPYTWSLAGTQLPNGLSFSSAGVLSGTPVNNSAGTYDFTIQLTDSSNRVVPLGYSIDIIY
jgi:hypothetical protein